MDRTSLLSLPRDILVTLPEYLHNIEDFTNLSSTCRELRACLDSTNPNVILRLAAAQESTFFRPAPFFLVAATARELGAWARQSAHHEAELALKMEDGVEPLLDLALQHCGLTMQRIRDLHRMRFEIINPIVGIMADCVGYQWGSSSKTQSQCEDSEDDEHSDAGTICADADRTFFLLVIYSELFGPDFAAVLEPANAAPTKLAVATRLEYIKYCVPDWGFNPGDSGDPQLAVKQKGPYARKRNFQSHSLRECESCNYRTAISYVLTNRRWRAHWRRLLKASDCGGFPEVERYSRHPKWRQRFWEGVLLGQGLEGFGMISPAIPETVRVERWGGKLREWKSTMRGLQTEPQRSRVGHKSVFECPVLEEDLWAIHQSRNG